MKIWHMLFIHRQHKSVITRAALFIFALLPQDETPGHTHKGNHMTSLKYLWLTWILKRSFPLSSVMERTREMGASETVAGERMLPHPTFISLPSLRSYFLMAGCWQNSFHHFLAHLHISWQPDLEYWIVGLHCNDSGLWISMERDQKVHQNILPH